MNEKNNNQGKFLIIGIFILFVGIIVATFTILKLNSNPYQIYINTLDNLFNYLEVKTINEDIKLDMNLNLHSSLDESFNDVGLSLNYYFSPQNMDKHIYDLDLNIDNKNLLNLKGIIDEKKVYFYLNDIYDKFIKINLPNMNFNYEEIKENWNFLNNKFKNALIYALNEDYFAQETTSITHKDKEIKVNKNIFKLTKDNLKEIINSIYKELNNEEVLTKLSKITNIDYDTLKKDLEDYYNQVNSSDFEYEETNIIIYTKKYSNEIIKLEITQGNKSLSVTQEDKYNYNFELRDNEIINGTMTIKNDAITYKLGNEDMEINFDLKITKNVEIPDYNYNNYIEFTEISDNDMTDILTKLYEKIIKLGLNIEV